MNRIKLVMAYMKAVMAKSLKNSGYSHQKLSSVVSGTRGARAGAAAASMHVG